VPALALAGAAAAVAFAGSRLGGNDEGALLTAAGKLLRGGVFYRDVDAYPFPGAHYLLAGAMALFGEHLAVARALGGALFVGVVVSLYALALPLLGAARAALFGAALLAFKLLAWPAFTAFFYWDLAFALAVTAIGIFLAGPPRCSPRRLVVVGALVGLAFASKQNVGVYLGAALALVVVVEGRSQGRAMVTRGLAPLALGFALAVTPGLLYFAAHGLLDEMIRSGIVRPFTDYAPTSGISYATPLRWWEIGRLQGPPGFSYSPEPLWTLLRRELLPGGAAAYRAYWLAGEVFLRAVYTAMPLAFVGAAVLAWRARGGGVAAADGHRDEARALTVFTVLCGAVVLSAFPRPDFAHMMGVYPLVLLLLLAVAGRLAVGTASRRALARLEVVAVATCLILCAGLSGVLLASMTARLDVARASLRVWPEDAFMESVVRFVDEEVAPGEPLFVYGHEAYYYFLTGRYSPWRFSQLYPGQAGGDGGAKLVSVLERSDPPVVVQGFVRFPGVPALPEQLPHLDAFLKARYVPTPAPFDRHPPAAGRPPPPHRLQVLVRRSGSAGAGR
jgi:hypothetical protein